MSRLNKSRRMDKDAVALYATGILTPSDPRGCRHGGAKYNLALATTYR